MSRSRPTPSFAGGSPSMPHAQRETPCYVIGASFPHGDRSRARSSPPAGCAAAPRDRSRMVCHATVMVASAKRGFGSDPPGQLPPASEVTIANIRAPRRTRSRSPHRRRRTLGRSLARPCRACAGKRSPCLPASASSAFSWRRSARSTPAELPAAPRSRTTLTEAFFSGVLRCQWPQF